jgi:hypothetical protein
MEIAALILLILAERARPDLYVRRWWAGLGLPRPALPVRVPVPVALAGVEARRLVFRVTSLGVLLIVARLFPPTFVRSPYDGVNALVGFRWAVFGLVVLALVAATSGRDRGQELLDALPRGGRSRVLSWSVLLIGAAVVEYGLLLVLRYGPASPPYVALLPNAWELAQGPLMLVGGGLLGLLGARFMPSWVATPVCVVLSVVWVGSFTGPVTSTRMVTPLVEWIQYHEDARIIVEPGSFAWHNAYLLGLCGLGLLAALLREPGPRRGLLSGGAGIVAATALAGALALP